MLNSTFATGGMITAPHHLAAMAGRDVLAKGGSAVQAMVAAASTIAVVYPHMNAVGGDGFWLIKKPGKEPVAVRACGQAAKLADIAFYEGCAEIPSRGPKAALTVPGCIGGWKKALEYDAETGGREMPLSEILASAIGYAKNGVAVTMGQERITRDKLGTLKGVHGFDETFLDAEGKVLGAGSVLVQGALAKTLETLAEKGLDDFYRGSIAEKMAAELEKIGSPLRLADFAAYDAQVIKPLSVKTSKGTIYNHPAPTQGAASLQILAIFDRLWNEGMKADSFEHVHAVVEATKQAFLRRNAETTDPEFMKTCECSALTDEAIDAMAARIDMKTAMEWDKPAKPGDTIWMGAADKDGCVVSYIQSIYWEYGSGVVLKDTGVVMQNRGCSFQLDSAHINALVPGKRPFHTLNPAMAVLDDGRIITYGTMGGEGQPQTQAALYTRYVYFGCDLQHSITAPRWLLGRTWGEKTGKLRLESRFAPETVAGLLAAGHDMQVLDAAFTDTMGHAGAVVLHPSGVMQGAQDPRSDGIVAAI